MDSLVKLLPFEVLLTAVVSAAVVWAIPVLLKVKAKAEETELEVAKTYAIAKALVVEAVEFLKDGKLDEEEKAGLNKKLSEIVVSAKEVLK